MYHCHFVRGFTVDKKKDPGKDKVRLKIETNLLLIANFSTTVETFNFSIIFKRNFLKLYTSRFGFVPMILLE